MDRSRHQVCDMRDIVERMGLLASAVFALTMLTAAACGTAADEGTASRASAPASASATTAAAGGLTPFQLEHGIGPITTPVALAGIDKAMAQQGHEVFEHKCAACHKMGERYVGPALGEVTKRRSPAFILNMVLNPQGMVERHPVTRKLLGEFFTQMPNQQLTPEEARKVLEYLRTQADAH
jgi:cytochrome c1